MLKGGEAKADKIEELIEYNKKILKELAEAKQNFEQLEDKVRQLTLEKAAISENYQALRKKVYGRSNEKSSYVDYANSLFQLSLFPEEEPKNLMVQGEEKMRFQISLKISLAMRIRIAILSMSVLSLIKK